MLCCRLVADWSVENVNYYVTPTGISLAISDSTKKSKKIRKENIKQTPNFN